MHETGFSSSLTWVLYLGLLSLARGEAPRHAHIMECGQRAGGGTAVLAHGSEGPLGSHRYRRHGEDLRGSVSSRRGTVEASTVLSVVAVCGSCQRPAGISVFRLRAIRWPAKVYGVHPTFGLRCFPRTDGIRRASARQAGEQQQLQDCRCHMYWFWKGHGTGCCAEPKGEAWSKCARAGETFSPHRTFPRDARRGCTALCSTLSHSNPFLHLPLLKHIGREARPAASQADFVSRSIVRCASDTGPPGAS